VTPSNARNAGNAEIAGNAVNVLAAAWLPLVPGARGVPGDVGVELVSLW